MGRKFLCLRKFTTPHFGGDNRYICKCRERGDGIHDQYRIEMDNGRNIGEKLQRIQRTVAEKYGIQYELELAGSYDKETLNRCDEQLRALQRRLADNGIHDMGIQIDILEATNAIAIERIHAEIARPEPSRDTVQDNAGDADQSVRAEAFSATEPADSAPTKDEPAANPESPHDFLQKYNAAYHEALTGTPQPQSNATAENQIPDLSGYNDWDVFMECAVAGISYHNIDEIWDELYEGEEVALVRDRNNEYDTNAVAVALKDGYDGDPDNFDFRFILGYIPRNCNQALAALLDNGMEGSLEAEITQLDESRPYSDRLHIEIYVRKKDDDEDEDEDFDDVEDYACNYTEEELKYGYWLKLGDSDRKIWRKFLKGRRIYMKQFSEKEWNSIESELWETGLCHLCWDKHETGKEQAPEKGSIVVFAYHDGPFTCFRLMKVLATGDGCLPFVGDGKMHVADGRTDIVFSKIAGGLDLSDNETDQIRPYLDKTDSHPLLLLPEDLSDKILQMMLYYD